MGGGEFVGVIVLVRTRQPERRDGAHHQPGIELPERLIGKAQLGHAAGRIVVDEDIGLGNELPESGGVPNEVQAQPAFVGVERQKRPAFFRIDTVVGEGPPLTGGIAARLLDLDDLGAQITDQLAGIGCGHHLAQLQHPYPFESSHDTLLLVWIGQAYTLRGSCSTAQPRKYPLVQASLDHVI